VKEVEYWYSNIWRMELIGKEAMKPPSKPLFSRSSDESQPRFSPDGNRIVFVSKSSGSSEIWVCDSDGTKPVKPTDLKARSVGSPRWSPDGRLIVFDSNKLEIWTYIWWVWKEGRCGR
jgi:Tol biopolymer transport system component